MQAALLSSFSHHLITILHAQEGISNMRGSSPNTSSKYELMFGWPRGPLPAENFGEVERP